MGQNIFFGYCPGREQFDQPQPANEPALIDPVTLAAKIHERLAPVLTPVGFAREGDEWRRDGEVPQTLRLQTGLTSRVETRFFLRLTLEATPQSILFHLPMLPARMAEMSEPGYHIRAGPTIFAAIRQQLGLALERQKVDN